MASSFASFLQLRFDFVPEIRFKLFPNFQGFRMDHAGQLGNLKDYTNFTQFSLLFVMLLINNLMLLLCFLQVMKRQEIKNFVNCSLKKRLEEKYFKKFKKIGVKILAFSLTAFTLNVISSFCALMKFTISSLIACFVIFYSSLVTTGFITFVQTFESFAVASMKEFKK